MYTETIFNIPYKDLLEFLNRIASQARGEIMQLYICGFERLLDHIVLRVSLPYCSFTRDTCL